MSTTSGNFTVTNGTPDDIGKLDAALTYLQGSQTAVGNLSALTSQSPVINIIHDGQDQSYINPDTGQPTIDWDPDSGLTLTGGTYQSPALGLGHEVGHLVDPNGMSDTPDSNYGNQGDQTTITQSEDPEAHDLGEPTRSDHGGVPRPDTASTDHTPTAADAPPVADSPGDGGGPYPGSIPTDPPPVNPDPDPTDPGTGDGGDGGGDGGGGGGGGDGGGGDDGGDPVVEEEVKSRLTSHSHTSGASAHHVSLHLSSESLIATHVVHSTVAGSSVSAAEQSSFAVFHQASADVPLDYSGSSQPDAAHFEAALLTSHSIGTDHHILAL